MNITSGSLDQLSGKPASTTANLCGEKHRSAAPCWEQVPSAPTLRLFRPAPTVLAALACKPAWTLGCSKRCPQWALHSLAAQFRAECKMHSKENKPVKTKTEWVRKNHIQKYIYIFPHLQRRALLGFREPSDAGSLHTEIGDQQRFSKPKTVFQTNVV